MVLVLSSNETQAFIKANQQTLAELLTFLDFADEKLALSFIEINFEPDKRLLIEILKNHPDCQNIEFLILEFADPALRFLQDELIAKFKAFTPDPQKKLVVMLLGLEYSIGMTGSYPPVLQDLNFIRDSLLTTVPHPLLLVLPDYSLTRVAKYAPDFWAWRYMVFRFKTTDSVRMNALEKISRSESASDVIYQFQKLEKIDLLERLLMEYNPSGNTLLEENLVNYVKTLQELGAGYYHLGMLDQGRELLEDAIQLVDKNKILTPLKADISYELAKICVDQEDFEKASTLFSFVLNIDTSTKNIQGIAAISHEIGRMYYNCGEVEKAISYFQKSLKIKEQIGDREEIAVTLNQLGAIYSRQGEIEKAISLFQQSLNIQEQMRNIDGKAIVLHELGTIHLNRGEIDKALSFFQTSFEIQEKTGNKARKAAILHELGRTYERMGEIEKALSLYQSSIEIKEQIGDVKGKAGTLHQLAMINVNQGDVERALFLFRQALEIDQASINIADKAATLAMMGQLLADKKGDYQKGLAYLEQSLAILQRLRPPDAATVQRIIARIRG